MAMQKTLHRVLIGLIVLLLFPVVLFTAYEYTRVSDDEELINTVYRSQLETIVSSINSYTQDVADNWASKLGLWLETGNKDSIVARLVDENQAINGIYLWANGKVQTVYQTAGSNYSDGNVLAFQKEVSKEVKQLTVYYQNNYRKFASRPVSDNQIVLYFICGNADNRPVVCFLLIDRQRFLQNTISPRIQSIAQHDFVITLFHQPTGKVLLSTEKMEDGNKTYDQTGSMWLVPQVNIGIGLKNQTIAQLASKRALESMVLIGIVFGVLLAGVWFLYRSVKSEIMLAQVKSEFISNVSHEIRTPLALISMYIETLEMGRAKSTEKVREYYGIIGKETERLSGIVNKILNFSKLESGKRHFKRASCNLNTIVANVLDTYRFHFNSNGFTYRFTPFADLPANLCDAEAVAEAIINLLDNAMKYSADKKQIEIRTGVQRHMTYVEVKDYGRGIAKRHQKMVFDKFYRVTNENLANEVKGTGLGLSIVDEIVKAHKGKVTLQSKPGEGCTFRLLFPVPNQHN